MAAKWLHGLVDMGRYVYHVYRILLSIYDCGEFSFLGSYPSHPLPHLFVSSIELMDGE
jgi:hypothetical protein